MKPLLASLRALGPARLAALGGVGVATLGLVLALAWRLSATAPMALLYNDLDPRDTAAMVDLLDKAHIPHDVSPDGTTLNVPRDQVAQARLDMAKSGLPNGGSIGYEIFDRGDGLTASQFEQSINQTRAMEGELERSIKLMRGVRGARVHLVLAHHEPFAQEEQQAQASVMLTLAGAAGMDRESVQAMVNLIAGAVPGLKPQNIAIVDSRGDLLARAGQPSGGGEAASSDEALRQAAETRLSQQVEDLLSRTLGTGHVRAEATVEMDDAQTQQTEEKYDPDQQVARSTQSITDTQKNTEKDATVSVQNNLPNPDNGSANTGSQSQRQEETTNYEIGKTTTTTLRDQPKIGRVSLAVLVDGVTSVGPNGKPSYRERSADELNQIGDLVRGAIGYDAARGDKVDIVSMRFVDQGDGAPVARAGLFGPGLSIGMDDIMRLAQPLLLCLVVLVVALTVLRPAALRLTTVSQASLAHAASTALSASAGALAQEAGGPAGLLTDESMVNIDSVEGQIRASSLRRIGELIDKHPEESLAIVRGWIAQERPA